jgi:uncharacterized repeat protein (TIGR01451 family)
MSKFSTIAAGLAVVPVLGFAAPVFAATNPGQIESGNIYRVRNVTATPSPSAPFADTVSASCGDTVQFRVRVHNSGPEALTNVKVAATLDGNSATSHGSKVTVSADNNLHDAVVTDTAGVSTDKATKISYVTGSTELLGYSATAGQSPVLGPLPDGIVAGGVNMGTVGPLTPDTESVQFKAKLTCDVEQPKDIKVCNLADKKVITIKETEFDAAKHSKDLNDCKTTTPGNITVCELSTKKVITIKETEFDAAKHTKDLNKCATTVTPPTELAKTGPAETVAVVLGAIVAGTVASRLFLSRRTQ